MLHRSAVEAGNRLEFVERHDDLAPAHFGEPCGKREHLLREAGDVAIGSDVRERHRQRGPRLRSGQAVGRVAHLGACRPDDLAQPRARAIPFGFRRHERARVAFEKRHVGAEAADGDVDRQGAAARHRGERAADQRRLAVAARRDQKDLLGSGQIADQPVELRDAVHEGGGRHHLAVDEGILHYGNRRIRYVISRNGRQWQVPVPESSTPPFGASSRLHW